ncbi:MAG TPA: hypothetical protein PLR74_04750 [Agriterribacter sp.]|nr:hypothetical protein [Agriterribacter sp.]
MGIKIQYRHNNLRFRYPFTISKGTKTHQPSLLTALHFNGITGFGEAPAITYYDITVEKMIADMERKKLFIEKFAFTHPERYWHYLHHLFPANPFLVAALDIAAWDIRQAEKAAALPVVGYGYGESTLDRLYYWH